MTQQIEHVMALSERMCREVDALLDMWCGIMRDWLKANDPDPETNLKPCPFCAGKADLGITGDGLHYVFCDWCGLQAPGQYRADQAIDSWNQRNGEI